MKVCELSGKLLALWVARASKMPMASHTRFDEAETVYSVLDGNRLAGYIGGDHVPQFAPHDNWAQGGPLLEQHIVAFENYDNGDEPFFAVAIGGMANGPTLLIAAMRAFVGSVYGDEVPDEVSPCN